MYAGLMSESRWAELSYDASYASTNMYDVRVQLATGSMAPTGALAEVASGVAGVSAAEERLIVPIQFDASNGERTVIVRGVMIGTPIDSSINKVHILAGRRLEKADAGQATVVLERNFGSFYGLAASGDLTLAGGAEVTYVGQGVQPEYFIVRPPEGGFFGQAEYGVLFTSLESAQLLGGVSDMVNDLLVTTSSDVDRVSEGIRQAFASLAPELGATVTTQAEDPTLRLLYDDLEGDRQFFRVFAALIFAGAIAAGFNLTSRMVESIRREIGIAMALGVSRARIAVRPLLVGAQIAVLGALFGVGIGFVVNQALRQVLIGFLPLPEWRTPFLVGEFASGAAIGFIVPFAAAALPVWRALRVQPVEAIRTGHLAVRPRGMAPLLRGVPGDSFAKIPFRNLFRAPRRTVLTALGIGASLTVLVGMVVMVDSFLATVDLGEAEVTEGAPDRIIVGMTRPQPVDSPWVLAVVDADTVGRAEPGLRIPAEVRRGQTEFELLLEVVDLYSQMWRPTFVQGAPSTEPGLVLAEKAAADLEVGLGDQVTLRHPRRSSIASFALVDTDLKVIGVHPHPFRFVAYLDYSNADILGLSGITNALSVEPASGLTFEAVQRELFDNPGVASVQPAGAVAEVIRDFLQQFLGILQVAEGVAVFLVFLIAFNSAAIAFDERLRDSATMMAFGVKRGTIMRMSIVENGLLGLVSTTLGAAGGYAFLRWAVDANVRETLPDVGLRYTYTPTLVIATIVLGIVVVAIAPLLTYRRLRSLDVPSTLRVME